MVRRGRTKEGRPAAHGTRETAACVVPTRDRDGAALERSGNGAAHDARGELRRRRARERRDRGSAALTGITPAPRPSAQQMARRTMPARDRAGTERDRRGGGGAVLSGVAPTPGPRAQETPGAPRCGIATAAKREHAGNSAVRRGRKESRSAPSPSARTAGSAVLARGSPGSISGRGGSGRGRRARPGIALTPRLAVREMAGCAGAQGIAPAPHRRARETAGGAVLAEGTRRCRARARGRRLAAPRFAGDRRSTPSPPGTPSAGAPRLPGTRRRRDRERGRPRKAPGSPGIAPTPRPRTGETGGRPRFARDRVPRHRLPEPRPRVRRACRGRADAATESAGDRAGRRRIAPTPRPRTGETVGWPRFARDRVPRHRLQNPTRGCAVPVGIAPTPQPEVAGGRAGRRARRGDGDSAAPENRGRRWGRRLPRFRSRSRSPSPAADARADARWRHGRRARAGRTPAGGACS